MNGSGVVSTGRDIKSRFNYTVVSKAIATISMTIKLAARKSPIYQAPEQYIRPIARLIKGITVRQLAVPVKVEASTLECHIRQRAAFIFQIHCTESYTTIVELK